jgi:hypothetical protein
MRPLHDIARDILNDSRLSGNSRVYAEAYLEPMLYLNTVDDYYYLDSGDSIVRYALANLTHYRGEKARELKAELKSHLIGY